MLKQRIITALLLVAFIGGPVLLLPPSGFIVLALAVFSVAAWEWSRLCALDAGWQQAVYIVLTLLIMSALLWASGAPGALDQGIMRALFTVAGVWWALALLWIQSYPGSAAFWQATPVRALMGWLVIVPCCLAMIYLRLLGPYVWMVLYVVALVAAADIGAYFFGKAYGRAKLAPRVSPGKSWAGLFGGMACALLFALIVALLLELPIALLPWLVIALIVGLGSVLGDLLESMLKRHHGVKDSSNILPGHGGVLDRMDGWMAAAPLFVLCLLSTGWSQ